jgi:hypothetical protein
VEATGRCRHILISSAKHGDPAVLPCCRQYLTVVLEYLANLLTLRFVSPPSRSRSRSGSWVLLLFYCIQDPRSEKHVFGFLVGYSVSMSVRPFILLASCIVFLLHVVVTQPRFSFNARRMLYFQVRGVYVRVASIGFRGSAAVF